MRIQSYGLIPKVALKLVYWGSYIYKVFSKDWLMYNTPSFRHQMEDTAT